MGQILAISKQVNRLAPSTFYQFVHTTVGPNGLIYDDMAETYVVTSYDKAVEILDDADGFSKPDKPHKLRELCQSEAAESGLKNLSKSLLFFNDADHRERNSKLTKYLSQAKVLDEAISEVAKNSVDDIIKICRDGESDIYQILQGHVHQLALRTFCLSASADLLNLNCVNHVVALLDGKFKSTQEICGGLESLNQIIATISYHEKYADLCEDDRIDMAVCFVAAHESAAYQIVNLMLYAPKMINDSDQVAKVVNEALRIDPPIQILTKTVSHISSVAKKHGLQVGDRVAIHLGAASNDSRVFKAPANFSLTRSIRPIFFGGGNTRCPGAGLSQVFIRRVLEELASSVNAINVKKIIPNHGLNGRGLKSAFVQVL